MRTKEVTCNLAAVPKTKASEHLLPLIGFEALTYNCTELTAFFFNLVKVTVTLPKQSSSCGISSMVSTSDLLPMYPTYSAPNLKNSAFFPLEQAKIYLDLFTLV